MSDGRGSRMVSHVVVIILAATLPAAMFGKPGDGYFEFLKEFQTLLTGLLAVGAAAYTISEMIKSDAKQEQRHRETIEISMLPSKLAVARVADFLPGRLRHYSEQFRLFDELVDKNTFQPSWDKQSLTLAIRVCVNARNLHREVLSDRVTSCQHLFDNDVMQNLEEFRTWSGELISRLPEGFATSMFDDDDVVEPPEWYNRALYMFMEVTNRSSASFANDIDAWAKQFHLPKRKDPPRPSQTVPVDAAFPHLTNRH
ncbi:hypothetical protein M2267_002244 [Ensifer sp. KUDG1]|uniref:hypothetical protein n=1 Tax=Ensifer sp. KUDG1 TaxID=3373919 RepID=UPI003D236D62